MAEWHGFQPPHPLEIDLQAEQMWIIKKKKKKAMLTENYSMKV